MEFYWWWNNGSNWFEEGGVVEASSEEEALLTILNPEWRKSNGVDWTEVILSEDDPN